MPAFLASNVSWIVLALAIGGFWWWKRPDLSTERAHQLVEAGAALVDVRSPAEFAAGHIDGARNIPVGEVGGRAAQIGPHDRPVVVYCASGTRSAIARRALRSAGFKEVYNLGPMSRW
jgi:phage shock protein E